jgi:mRNA interferase MazF
MVGILRGDIFFADLEPVQGHGQSGNRSVLVINHDVLNRNSGAVIALALTSREPNGRFPLSHTLPPDIGRQSLIELIV